MDVLLLTAALPADDPGDRPGALAQGLAGLGHGVTVAVCGGGSPVGVAGLGGAAVVGLEAVAGRRFDVAIATDWTTYAHLFAVDAVRWVGLVEGFADRGLGSWQAERIAAALVYDLPCDYVCLGAWVASELRELRPSARVVALAPGVGPEFGVAGGGVRAGAASPLPAVAPGAAAWAAGASPAAAAGDKGSDGRPSPAAAPGDVADPEGRAAGPPGGESSVGHGRGGAAPLRVVVDDGWLPDGAPSAARSALALCAEAVEARWLPDVDAAQRAEAYRDADVLLRLDGVDGVLGVPLEAARCGCVPLVLPAGGTEDLVEHLVSGVVGEPDDARGIARWLDHLARDRALLGRLRAGAVDAAAGFPTAAEAARSFAEALEALVAVAPPDDARWPVRLMADAMAGVAVYRGDHYALSGMLERLEADEAYRAAARARELWEAPGLAGVRRVAGPVARRMKRRVVGG